MVRQCFVYWGPTGTGKSRRAWDEAGVEAYCKDPRTKFWDGYQVEENVVIDEFRGGGMDNFLNLINTNGEAIFGSLWPAIWSKTNVHPANQLSFPEGKVCNATKHRQNK